VWPGRTDNPFSAALDNTMKYVASTTLNDPLPWTNSTLLKGNAEETVRRLKGQLDKDLLVMGSGELVKSLMRHDLVDEYTLLIHPLLLGSGRRLFPDDGPFAPLRLVNCVTATTGVMMATYRPAEPAARGADLRRSTWPTASSCGRQSEPRALESSAHCRRSGHRSPVPAAQSAGTLSDSGGD
jgi:dihydrofolate reductase